MNELILLLTAVWAVAAAGEDDEDDNNNDDVSTNQQGKIIQTSNHRPLFHLDFESQTDRSIAFICLSVSE